MSVKVSRELDGAVLRLTLELGKGNVIDTPAVKELAAGAAEAKADPKVRAVLIDAAGPDFSFGLSVPEHKPEVVGEVLPRFHRMLLDFIELPLPVLVAVKGRCLGGGLELALAGSRLFVQAGATLGQPEIKLAVFAPAASAFLPFRIGQAKSEELLLSGRNVTAEDAVQMGLCDELVPAGEDPAQRALGWVHGLLELSPTSLRFAVQAARRGYAQEAAWLLGEVEKLYLDELMKTPDAKEGIAAFLEKRKPRFGGTN